MDSYFSPPSLANCEQLCDERAALRVTFCPDPEIIKHTHTACQVKDRPGTPHRFRLMFTKNNTWVYCKMHRMLITAQQKYLSVGRVDISAPRPLSLGCPSSLVEPPESLRVLQPLDVPCDVPLLGPPQTQQSCDDYKDCCLHWDSSCSSFLRLLSLGPARCPADSPVCQAASGVSHRISAWSFSTTFGGVSHFELRVSSPVRQVQLFM